MTVATFEYTGGQRIDLQADRSLEVYLDGDHRPDESRRLSEAFLGVASTSRLAIELLMPRLEFLS